MIHSSDRALAGLFFMGGARRRLASSADSSESSIAAFACLGTGFADFIALARFMTS
jgi:hypothetical protein